MIIVGTNGEHPIKGVVLGSVPHKLLHLSHVPGTRRPKARLDDRRRADEKINPDTWGVSIPCKYMSVGHRDDPQDAAPPDET